MGVDCHLEAGILVVTIRNPPVNALSRTEREGLIAAMRKAALPAVRAVIIRGDGDAFIAGADIKEFDLPPQAPHLPEVTEAIEACPKPVVAAIVGLALGGGLEIALACHARIAATGARLGLPEVSLGIVPGAGGTQRLPRLIDPLLAASMIGGGKPIDAQQALDAGLIDKLVERDQIMSAARRLALQIEKTALDAHRLSLRTPAPIPDQAAALDKVKADVTRAARGAVAPGEGVRLVDVALSHCFTDGVAEERRTFLELRSAVEAAALRHIFLAERAAARLPADVAGAEPRSVDTVGVVGAGTMGSGIAMSFADAGLPVVLIEANQEFIDRGLARIAAAYEKSVSQGRISEAQARERTKGVSGATDYQALAEADLIVEAAFETMEVKRAIFERLDAVAKPGAVLATNTSYLDLDQIAATTNRPEAVVGMHYFSPANVMKLLEVVRGRATSGEALATALAVARRTKKVPVVAGVCNGFIGNRMLKAYVRETGLLLLEGATPEQVDRAMTGFGMAMGPFAVADLSGIDIAYNARKAMPAGSYEPLAVLVHNALVEAGHLGRKTGSGFYLYADGRPSPNPLVSELIDYARSVAGMTPRTISDEEIVERCILALGNEGGFIVDEGIAARAGDIDVVYVNGYGFPRHRGGPMFYIERHIGRENALARIEHYRRGRFGKWWQPSPWLGAPSQG